MRLVALSVVALAGACSATHATVRIVPRGVTHAATDHPATWTLTVLPDDGARSPFRSGDEQDASVNVFAGGMRLSVRGDHVDWAHDLTLHPIIGHARDGDRWFFATADGALFGSTGFTGSLERIGDDTPGWSLCGRTVFDECAGFDSTGVLAVRSAEQRLFLGTRTDGLVPARAPLDRPLVDVGFVDREFGAAIVAPGLLFRTLDGGATTERVDLGGDVAFVVYPHHESFVLATTRGLLRLERTGPPVAFSGAPEVFDHTLGDEAAHAINESLPQGDPLVWPVLLAHGGILLSTGRIATIEGDALHLRDRNGGDSPFDLPGASCSIHPFGERIVASCENDQHLRTVQTFLNDRWSELRTLPSMGPILVAPDGGGIVAMGPCSDDDGRPRDATPVCWFNGVTWQTRMLPGDAHLGGLHGDALLFETSDPADDHADHGSVRIAHAGALDEGEPLEVPGAQLVSAAFAANGSIVAIAERDGHRVLAHGEVGGPLAVRPLPSNTSRVAFVDSQRGLAVGAHLTDLFATVDGGQSWSRLELPIDGDASNVSLESDQGVGDDRVLDDPYCAANYCSVNGRVVWSAPTILSPNGVRVLAATHGARMVAAEDRIIDPRQQGYRIVRWSCDLRDPPPSDVTRTLPAGRLYGSDGWLDPHVTAAADGGAGRYAFAWAGVDERGSFRAQARAVTLPAVNLAAASSTGTPVSNSDSVVLSPRLLTRTLAIVERCAGPFYAGQCDLVSIPAAGIPSVLGTERTLVGGEDTVVHLRSVLALGDGGAALLLSTAFPTFASEDRLPARLDAVLRISPRGAIAARRMFTWSRGRTVRMLARNAQGPGLLVATTPAMRSLAWYGIDPANDGPVVATLPDGPLPTCTTDAPAADSTTFVSAETEYAPSLDIASARFILLPPFNARDVLEASGGTVCLRGISFWTLNPTDELLLMDYLGGPPRIRAAHGTLEGTAFTAPHGLPMRCEIP